MENALNNHLIVGRILANLPHPDLIEARSVSRTWKQATFPYLRATIRLDPTILLLSDQEIIRAKFKFLGSIGQLRLFLSNHSFPSPYYMTPEPISEIMEFRQTFRTSNPTKSILYFFQDLLPLVRNAVTILRWETNLETDEDLARLEQLLQSLPALRRLCLALIKIKEPVLNRAVQTLENSPLLPNLTHFYPMFRLPNDLSGVEEEAWKLQFRELMSSIGPNIEDLDLEGHTPIWDRPSVWLEPQDLAEIAGGFSSLKSVGQIYGRVGTLQFLRLNSPLCRLYLVVWSGFDFKELMAVFSKFSETLTLIDIMWQVDLIERIGQRASLPLLPALRSLSMSVFSVDKEKDWVYPPPVDNLRDERYRDIFQPAMLDPFMIKETLAQGLTSNLPRLETLYLLFPHLRGEEIWDYFFPEIQNPKLPQTSVCSLRKLVISRIKDKDEYAWRTFRDFRVKPKFQKLERLRYFDMADRITGDEVDSVYVVPEETYFPGLGQLEQEFKERGVWLKFPDIHFDRQIPLLMQFSLRNSSFHKAFLEYDGNHLFI